jgi:hypothetical protein
MEREWEQEWASRWEPWGGGNIGGMIDLAMRSRDDVTAVLYGKHGVQDSPWL